MIEQPQRQPPRRVQRSQREKQCPSCGRKVPADSWKCRYCAELLDALGAVPPLSAKKSSTCLVLVITGTVVLVLFGIVAAIAIPNILESRTAANEAAAISSCRVVSSAQELHHARFDRYATLEELAGNMFIDSILAGGRKSGYDFELAVAEDGQSWSMTVWPVTPGTTGDRSFYIDESGIVRYDIFVSEDDMPADSTSTPLGGW